MLRLNGTAPKPKRKIKKNSNTTNVKVKLICKQPHCICTVYSNTTNVKVKRFACLKQPPKLTNIQIQPMLRLNERFYLEVKQVIRNSNTTNVKVKRQG